MDVKIDVSVDKPEEIAGMIATVEKQIEAHSGNCTLQIEVFDRKKYGLKVD